MMNTDQQKHIAAQAALQYIKPGSIIGVGTGSTVNCFISALNSIKHKIDGAVASSEATKALLQSMQIPIYELNEVNELPIYIDGADEVDRFLNLIKGGGGALTREKILSAAAKQFVCIVDQSKPVEVLGDFPLAIEVIPMARSYVARQCVKLGGTPVYREGFVTDNNHFIIDVHHLDLSQPISMEQTINNIAGVVCHGLFALRGADVVLVGKADGNCETIK